MSANPASVQFDLFAAPDSAPIELGPDPLAERVISSGLVANEFLLSLNASLGVVRDDLPSRMFQFPVEFVDRENREDGQSTLLLNHPDLAELPFLDEIERKSGVRPVWEPLDEYGRDRGARWRYFHAVDLLTDDHWRGLVETINFTDREGIIMGLRFHADCGGLSIPNMRAVLAEIGSAEPGDRSIAFLHSDEVRITNCQQGKFVGMWTRDEQSVWAAIHGVEAGLFKRERSGHLRFSPAFLAEKEARVSTTTSAEE